MEAIFLVLCYGLVTMAFSHLSSAWTALFAFAIAHTLAWCFSGNFWVYMLDSFSFVHNGGIDRVVAFTRQVRDVFAKLDCCNAILIYGSMSRSAFHGRSDLDLRIVRRTEHWIGMVCLPIAYGMRVYAFFIAMPVDFQVVDSMGFLEWQMRSDELPIVVFRRSSFSVLKAGLAFDQVLADPEIIMRDREHRAPRCPS